jgi:cell division protein FtsW
MSLRIDRTFLVISLLILVIGTITFLSASLGLLAREGVSLTRLYSTQVGLGLIGGLIGLFLTTLIPKAFFKQIAPVLYVLGILMTGLVFVPGIGSSANGAMRWIDLGFLSFQPSEFLKIGTVFFFAYLMSSFTWNRGAWWEGFVRLFGTLLIPVVLLVLEPDNDTLMILAFAVGTMYFVSGAPWRDIFIISTIGVISAVVLVSLHPYVLERVHTFLDPARDPAGSSYQIRQSLIAIGSGELIGRGVGQSVQKFNYLPEPVSDSVFAVYAEEVGFVGSTLLLLLFLSFFGRGMWLASRSKDKFSALLVIGLVSMIVYQAFLNIGAMLGVVPLTGLTLPFVSHGGTSLLVTLVTVGVILSVSKQST